MKIFDGLDFVDAIPNPVVTIGTFDGVHLGHQKILNQLNEEAKKCQGESVLITFEPHPRVVMSDGKANVKLIQTLDEKLKKLERCGLQNVIIYPFSRSFASLTALQFIEEILVNKLHAKKIVIGYDHQFGNNREGNIAFLQKMAPRFGYEVLEIAAQEVNDVNVSSTKIRNAILNGEMEIATQFLGEPFTISGTVVKGKQLGRTIGFPTANIAFSETHKIIPTNGVYAVELEWNQQRHKGMMNIGFRPTVDQDKVLSLEVHLFDFATDIYDEQVSIHLFKHFRAEQNFPNLEALKQQIARDENAIRTYFQPVTA